MYLITSNELWAFKSINLIFPVMVYSQTTSWYFIYLSKFPHIIVYWHHQDIVLHALIYLHIEILWFCIWPKVGIFLENEIFWPFLSTYLWFILHSYFLLLLVKEFQWFLKNSQNNFMVNIYASAQKNKTFT